MRTRQFLEEGGRVAFGPVDGLKNGLTPVEQDFAIEEREGQVAASRFRLGRVEQISQSNSVVGNLCIVVRVPGAHDFTRVDGSRRLGEDRTGFESPRRTNDDAIAARERTLGLKGAEKPAQAIGDEVRNGQAFGV